MLWGFSRRKLQSISQIFLPQGPMLTASSKNCSVGFSNCVRVALQVQQQVYQVWPLLHPLLPRPLACPSANTGQERRPAGTEQVQLLQLSPRLHQGLQLQRLAATRLLRLRLLQLREGRQRAQAPAMVLPAAFMAVLQLLRSQRILTLRSPLPAATARARRTRSSSTAPAAGASSARLKRLPAAASAGKPCTAPSLWTGSPFSPRGRALQRLRRTPRRWSWPRSSMLEGLGEVFAQQLHPLVQVQAQAALLQLRQRPLPPLQQLATRRSPPRSSTRSACSPTSASPPSARASSTTRRTTSPLPTPRG